MLDDTCTSYCQCEIGKAEKRLMDLEILKSGVFFAMKENLSVQFVYPNYQLPEEYSSVIETIDHVKIKPISQAQGADVIVLNYWDDCENQLIENSTCIIKTTRKEIQEKTDKLKIILNRVARLNIVFTDVANFSDDDISNYNNLLTELVEYLVNLYYSGKNVQLNILTDRALLSHMNNCDAGVNNITLAPNGKFYLCPAFYYENLDNHIGNLVTGVDIKNKLLLQLDHAPICRICDAYHCKRCIWLNEKLTLEYNTPSHQQCVMAHLERRATHNFLKRLDKKGIRLDNCQVIKAINYLDPIKNL